VPAGEATKTEGLHLPDRDWTEPVKNATRRQSKPTAAGPSPSASKDMLVH